MATTRSSRQLAENVLSDLGLTASGESPSPADVQYIKQRYEDLLAELEDEDMVYWDPDEIPYVIFEPMTKLVGLTVGNAFGVQTMAENIERGMQLFKRRIRRHTGRKSSGLPVEVEDF